MYIKKQNKQVQLNIKYNFHIFRLTDQDEHLNSIVVKYQTHRSQAVHNVWQFPAKYMYKFIKKKYTYLP